MRLGAVILILASGVLAQDLAGRLDTQTSQGAFLNAAKALARDVRSLESDLLYLEADWAWHTEDVATLEASLRRASKLKPEFIDAWLLLAWHLAYNRAEEDPLRREFYIARGLSVLDEALRQNPSHRDLVFEKAWIFYQRKGDLVSARRVLESIPLESHSHMGRKLSALVHKRLLDRSKEGPS